MSYKACMAKAGALCAAAVLIGVGPALAHTIVGNRVFPATLTIDDPGVNDELALPSFGYMAASNYDGTPGPISYTLGWEYAKTITADLGISVGSAGYTWQKNPAAGGWARRGGSTGGVPPSAAGLDGRDATQPLEGLQHGGEAFLHSEREAGRLRPVQQGRVLVPAFWAPQTYAPVSVVLLGPTRSLDQRGRARAAVERQGGGGTGVFA